MKWEDGIACTELGAWKIRYRVPLGLDTRATKQVVETLRGCKNRQQARQVLAVRMAAVFDQTYRPRVAEKPPTVADFAPLFLDAKSELPTHAKYESQLRRHLLPVFGRKLLRDVTVVDCDAYRRARLAVGAAPATARSELRCLQSLFVEAKRRELVDRDPVSGVAFGKIDNARQRLLGNDERERLAAALASREDFVRPLFAVLFYTGMRVGDACRLPWERVDLERGRIGIKQGKTSDWVYPPMHPSLKAELERWREACPSEKWVFPSPRGYDRPMSKAAVTKPWGELLAAAGVDNLWRHDLRRYLVTQLRAAGFDPKTIGRYFTGHKTTAMVDRYEIHDDAIAEEHYQRFIDLKAISLGQDANSTGGGAGNKKPEK